MKKLTFALLLLFATYFSIGQTGPGGVGNSSGANGQPQNVLWLRANTGVTTTGALVDSWLDQSGNNNSAIGTGATRPTRIAADADFNGLPALQFPAGAGNFFMQIPDNDNLDNTSTLSIFFIASPLNQSGVNGIISKRTGAGANQSYFIQLPNGATPTWQTVVGTSAALALNNSTTTTGAGQVDIISEIINGTAVTGLRDGAAQNVTVGPASIANNSSSLFIGSFDNSVTTNFEGELGEVIIYQSALNAAQRQIVENYLSSKYNIAITGDLFAGDAAASPFFNHDFDLAGIGFSGGTSHLLANSQGFILSPSAGTINVNGEFVLAAHNGITNTALTTNLGTGGVVQRWARTWYVDRTPAAGIDANITFDFSEGIGGQFPQNKDNYVLLKLNTGSGNYDVVSAITSGDKTLVGDQITFRVADANLIDGIYTLGTLNLTTSPVTGVSNRTWYSYQSGNWTAPSTWTLDGSVYPLYVNPSNEIPTLTDNVVITTARTVTMNVNNAQVNSMDVTGFLDLAATTGHNFVAISGPGRIRMGGVADNFPLGNATNFADPLIGGTLEINGAGISLNQPRTFNHVEVNMTAGANIATLMNNYTINGNLTITNGIFKFNDDATTANRTCRVNGNVVVTAAGGIRTGTGANGRHEFNLYGDFTNNGTANFTQRTDDLTPNAEAINGIVDVNMLSPSRDQSIVCNGVTNFYRIEINKGIDDTYKASISASATANFKLFGFKNDGHGALAQLVTNANALGLIYGTVEIGNNVVVLLNNTGNYNVSVGARLWVNGGDVSKTNGIALVSYGTIQVSSGLLTANTQDSGITLRDNGGVRFEGGTTRLRALRTATAGAAAQGSYTQTGGDVILEGGDVSDTYSVFSLTYTGNVFRMSGGTLTVQNLDNLGTITMPGSVQRGAIFINCDPSNVSVTGGNIIMEADNAIRYRVTSRAPFWNVTMRGTGALRDLELFQTASGEGTPAPGVVGVDVIILPIQPLVVLGDLTIENNARFTTNNGDVTVSGNFDINNGGSYVHGTNTTTLTGAGVSSLIFGNTAVTQTFNNLTVNKTSTSDEVAITSGRPGPVNFALQVNGILNVTNGIFDYGSFAVSAQGTSAQGAVNLASGTVVGKSASTGRLVLNGGALQIINSSLASIHNLDINNAASVRLETDDLTILKDLTLTNGAFNIQTFKLSLIGAAASITVATPGATRMIQTAGNASDGGLELYLDTNETLTFPIGVAGKYTPATAAFTLVTDDGLVSIRPVIGILQTTNLAGGNILTHYWRSDNSNFTTLPRVMYGFTYVTADLGGGPEANYIPGKVLNVSPFTRSSEADVNKVTEASNLITFNGTGTGFTLERANYTAGLPARFTGQPEVYYTRDNAVQAPWDTPATWTRSDLGGFVAASPHRSNNPASTTYPQAGDIAVIGWVPWDDPKVAERGLPHSARVNDPLSISCAEIIFTQMLDAGGNPTVRRTRPGNEFQFRPLLTLNSNAALGTIDAIRGEGAVRVRAEGTDIDRRDPNLANIDMGDFAAQDSSYIMYEVFNDFTITRIAAEVPCLMITSDGFGTNDRSVTLDKQVNVKSNLEILGDANLLLATAASRDVTVEGDLRLIPTTGGIGGGELRFSNTGTPRVVTIFGNLQLGNTSGAASAGTIVRVGGPNGTPITHTINLYGDFIQNTSGNNTDVAPNGNGFKAGTSAANDRIHVNLLGSTSMTLTNTATGNAPQFYSLTVNKGSSISSSASFNANFSIDGPTNLATKSLVLQNGLFFMNAPTTTVVLTSGGADFNIPGSAGLDVRAGTVSTTTTNTNANITLDGLLRISGGNATFDAGAGFPNYIEYSSSGNAAIEVTGGTLTVGGQVRRSLANTTGILRYTQSAGAVIVGNRGAPATTRGVFEVLNTGSQFNHSGGSFILVQGINSTTVPSLWLEPASSTITSGSTITIGNGSTPANSVNIGIQSTAILNNLTLAGSNNPVTKIYITPLTVNGNLLISAGTTLNANSQNLTIGGNFTVDGSYVPTTNVTEFTNTGAALISGATSLLNFYDFAKTGAGVTTVSKDITINQDLRVLAGTLASSTFTTNLKRHAQINGTLTNTTGSGLIFNGAVQQQLTRSAAGTGTLGIVTLNNSLGVIIPDGNGYNFDITTGLRLQQGVFDIGGSLLYLRTNAIITPVNPFSITNMIQTNSSFTDKGVKKTFPIGYTTDFTFPVGQLAYTPVIFNLSSPGNTTGAGGIPTITVRPANERHPSVIDDNQVGELPNPATFIDMNNVLRYHWIVNADNVVNSFRSVMTLSYPQSVVSVTAPYTEADYLAARVLLDANPTKLINKFTTADVNETTNIITFNFNGVTDAGISAEYFAGVDIAIPNNIPIYTTTASGNVDAAVYTPTVPGGGAPTGATVIVSPGHNLTLNISGVNLYETQISAGAIVTIPSNSTGHRLGTLTGTGDLRINSDISSAALPAAVYDDFFSCSGGGLIYGGNGTYEILGGVSTLRKLTLDGGGAKVLANNDIIVCDDFVINGGQFVNTNFRAITVQNDFLINAGIGYYVPGNLTVARDLILTAGNFNGGTPSAKVIGRDFIVNGGSFNSGSAANTIRIGGDMTVSGAATFLGGSASLTGVRYIFQGSAPQTLTGDFTGTRFINRLEINNSTGLTLAGNVNVESELLLTSGLIAPGSNTFTMNGSAVSNPVEGRATSFVNGRLYKVFPAAGNSFVFPIGSVSLDGSTNYWQTGAVRNVSAAGTWDMEFIGLNADAAESTVTNMTPIVPIVRMSTSGYWVVTDGSATPSGKTATIGLSWGPYSDVSANDVQRQELRVVQWEPGTSQWANKGGTNFSVGHSQSRGTFNASSTTSFSRRIVTLGSTIPANPLPVSFLGFTGRTENGINVLRWSTATERNNDYFEIERSVDNAESFETIGRLDGNGNSQTLSAYTFEDREASVGKNYYRLKQVDFDGTVSYHPNLVLLTLESAGDFLDFDVFPNPTKDQVINLKIFKNNNEDVQIRFYDMSGKLCLSQEANAFMLQLPTTNVSKGLYLIEVSQGFRRVSKRVMIKD